MARERGIKPISTNPRARFDFHLEELFEMGIVLLGSEVKSLRSGKGSIRDAYALISGGELWLENSHIPILVGASWTNHAPRRRRKLLARKNTISKLEELMRDGNYTLVPVKIYFKDGYVKLEVALARGKKERDKREVLRKRDALRQINSFRNARTQSNRIV